MACPRVQPADAPSTSSRGARGCWFSRVCASYLPVRGERGAGCGSSRRAAVPIRVGRREDTDDVGLDCAHAREQGGRRANDHQCNVPGELPVSVELGGGGAHGASAPSRIKPSRTARCCLGSAGVMERNVAWIAHIGQAVRLAIVEPPEGVSPPGTPRILLSVVFTCLVAKAVLIECALMPARDAGRPASSSSGSVPGTGYGAAGASPRP